MGERGGGGDRWRKDERGRSRARGEKGEKREGYTRGGGFFIWTDYSASIFPD